MLLVITNSYDATSDLLIPRLPIEKLFRFNTDFLDSYRISTTADAWSIQDPTGRRIDSNSLTKLYWRKPDFGFQHFAGETAEFCKSEIEYVIRHIVIWSWLRGLVVLVEPWAERRLGKLRQLQIGRHYFHSLPFEFVFNQSTTQLGASGQRTVVKSLAGSEVSSETVLYTTMVNLAELDVSFPWFTQELCPASHDLTIVYVRGRCWGFLRSRDDLIGSVDWRERVYTESRWSHFDLNDKLVRDVDGFMQASHLDFGRLDFLYTAGSVPTFLEVNPNGQFAWLDLNDQFGILSAVIEEIHPCSTVNPLPVEIY